MKLRVTAAIVLITLSVGFALYCLLRIESSARELTQALETAMAAALSESPEWEAATGEVVRLWQRERSFMHILLPHVNLNELEWAIGSLPRFLEQGDANMFVEMCVRGLQCVNTIREMERPTLGNIF